MKAKISRGKGFRGLLNYLYGPGEEKKPGRAVPIAGAGNVVGTDPQALAREFSVSRKLRPDISRPVWHCSLSLPPGEKLHDEKWAAIMRDFLIEMELTPENRQWHCCRHIDQKHDHVHLVVSRVDFDAQVWFGKNDVRRAIAATQSLEKKYGLQLTASFEEGGEKKGMKKGEVGRFRRTGEVPERFFLQTKVEEAKKECPDFKTFVDRLKKSHVQVLPAGKTGQVQGISFRLETGDPFSGSSLGKGFTWQRLAAEVHFDAVADADMIALLRKEAEDSHVAGAISGEGKPKELFRAKRQEDHKKSRDRFYERQPDGTWTSTKTGWPAFREAGNTIFVMSRNDAAIRASLQLANEKFGGKIKIMGTPFFCQRAWLLGCQMGLEVEGWTPTDEDVKALAEWKAKHRPDLTASAPLEIQSGQLQVEGKNGEHGGTDETKTGGAADKKPGAPTAAGETIGGDQQPSTVTPRDHESALKTGAGEQPTEQGIDPGSRRADQSGLGADGGRERNHRRSDIFDGSRQKVLQGKTGTVGQGARNLAKNASETAASDYRRRVSAAGIDNFRAAVVKTLRPDPTKRPDAEKSLGLRPDLGPSGAKGTGADKKDYQPVEEAKKRKGPTNSM